MDPTNVEIAEQLSAALLSALGDANQKARATGEPLLEELRNLIQLHPTSGAVRERLARVPRNTSSTLRTKAISCAGMHLYCLENVPRFTRLVESGGLLDCHVKPERF